LEAVFHLFAYLKKKPNGVVVLDPTYPDIDLRKFNDGVDDWKNIYGDIYISDTLNVSIKWCSHFSRSSLLCFVRQQHHQQQLSLLASHSLGPALSHIITI
jgi:hypothetical protein